MKFAKRVFGVAGIYGMLVMLPQYFLEGKINADSPPAITHPEYFYGFIGLALAWQFLFLLIASDPVRFRLAMLPAILEKLAFGVPAIILYVQHRLAVQVLVFGLIDLVLAVLFVTAFGSTREVAPKSSV
jgi:hypothetical protein